MQIWVRDFGLGINNTRLNPCYVYLRNKQIISLRYRTLKLFIFSSAVILQQIILLLLINEHEKVPLLPTGTQYL